MVTVSDRILQCQTSISLHKFQGNIVYIFEHFQNQHILLCSVNLKTKESNNTEVRPVFSIFRHDVTQTLPAISTVDIQAAGMQSYQVA